MLLPSPGPADPGGCGFSASQQLFADCSGFQVRRWRGQQPGQARSCHLSAARPCSNPPVRPSGVRAALGLPSGSLVLETETQRRQTGTLSKSRAAGERQIGTTLSCSCLGYTVGDAELGVGRVLEPGKRGEGETNLQPTQVTKCLWPPKKRATTRTGERHTGQPTARGGGRPSQAELSVLCLCTIHGVLGRGHIVSAGHGVQREAPRSEESNQEDIHGLALQIQCYQCEEFQLNNDCSSPEFIVNCTVNVQDMCQKEVMEQSAGIMYRKSCASSAACLIASAGYQSFCSPGKLNSVCISCCNTPLCNGPRPKKRGSSASAVRPGLLTTALLFNLALCLAHC
ncbi:ly6/PLAUR domain-containing protein 1 isoform X1 [Peromyscus maniculatus bairdii]|uniref:ly6/PLAUR domain-containing protein 1 isoform X1 n=1 Tax=Peromyscus maniculatus bairdii TaxID=230844 RepID=UPI003FD46EEB